MICNGILYQIIGQLYNDLVFDASNHKTAYKIDEETVLEDGSVLIRIRKQYNTVRVGAYLD